MTPEHVAIGAFVVGAVLAAAIGIAALVAPAVQAKRRGYSFFIWLAAGIFANNPIFLLVVLGVCPHRKRQALREQFRRELDAKLGDADVPAARPAGAARDASVGDAATVDPHTTGGRPVRDVSVGDAATLRPDGRSLGDEPTRPR